MADGNYLGGTPGGLAANPGMAERLMNWFRNQTALGQAVTPSIEQQRNLDVRNQIQNAGVDLATRELPPAQLPPPQAPAGYSVQDMMRSMVSEEARRKARQR